MPSPWTLLAIYLRCRELGYSDTIAQAMVRAYVRNVGRKAP